LGGIAWFFHNNSTFGESERAIGGESQPATGGEKGGTGSCNDDVASGSQHLAAHPDDCPSPGL
jgi:hypothetical protein